MGLLETNQLVTGKGGVHLAWFASLCRATPMGQSPITQEACFWAVRGSWRRKFERAQRKHINSTLKNPSWDSNQSLLAVRQPLHHHELSNCPMWHSIDLINNNKYLNLKKGPSPNKKYVYSINNASWRVNVSCACVYFKVKCSFLKLLHPLHFTGNNVIYY